MTFGRLEFGYLHSPGMQDSLPLSDSEMREEERRKTIAVAGGEGELYFVGSDFVVVLGRRERLRLTAQLSGDRAHKLLV